MSKKLTINLYDSCFDDDPSSTAGQIPQYIEYVRGNKRDTNNISLYTNIDIFTQNVDNPSKSYAWLYEAFDVMPDAYILFPQIIHKFKTIFTFYQPFCHMWPHKVVWVPAMGTWVGGNKSPTGGTIGIHKKSKLCSMICSPKTFTRGHQYRHHVANILSKEPWIDIYGLRSRFNTIDEPLQDYMFSVVVENGIQPGYFTEKILNCFAMGTIPIYHGDPNIEDIFDGRGIIKLEDFLAGKINLNENLYNDMIEYAKNNLSIMLDNHYNIPEDFIYQNYLKYYIQ